MPRSRVPGAAPPVGCAGGFLYRYSNARGRDARNAVLATFFLNGFALRPGRRGSRRSARPRPRAGRLGLLLLARPIGSVLALPTSGAIVQRFGARRVVVTVATVVRGLGLTLLAFGAGTLATVPGRPRASSSSAWAPAPGTSR